jgi:cell division protein FtsI (penicillin-binding protein 3)
MTAKDAVFIMEEAGITATVEGKGVVTAQSVAPGTPLVKGSDIVLTLQQKLTE